MKKLIAGLAISLVTLQLFAASVSVFCPTSGTGNIVKQGGLVTSSFVLVSTNTGASYVTFFDAPTNVITYVVGAYTNVAISSPASTTNIYTNYFGVTTTNIYTAVTTSSNTVSAATNTYPIMLTVTVPASNTTTINFSQRFERGITVTNNPGVTVTATYAQ